MGLVAKMAIYWHCDVCKEEWFADSDIGPRQCPYCRSRKWNDGMVGSADLFLRGRVVTHLNPHRRFLSSRQKAALMRIAAKKRAETAAKAAREGNADEQYSLGVAYMLGDGVPTDYAEAYFRFNLAAAGKVENFKPEDIAKLRDEVGSHLTDSELLQTQARIRKWFKAHPGKVDPYSLR
jgi:hypothetical protein